MDDAVGFLLYLWDQAPLPTAAILVSGGCAAALVMQGSFYAWYFLVLCAVMAFSLALGHTLACYVFVLGGLAGLAEFIGKFKDEPIKALRTGQALTYLAFNGLIAVFAYPPMVAYHTSPATLLDQIKVVVISGLGSMLIMRSRLFNVKIGNEVYTFGPDQIVKVYLRFMERAIDRVRAEDRYKWVAEVMEGVDF